MRQAARSAVGDSDTDRIWRGRGKRGVGVVDAAAFRRRVRWQVSLVWLWAFDFFWLSLLVDGGGGIMMVLGVLPGTDFRWSWRFVRWRIWGCARVSGGCDVDGDGGGNGGPGGG
ncbi:pollen-specific leucine-rich repeat extensin-like protein 3 [Iris pallida]|uniref:Pollen-specific leucine-rich repeat extensin-like protein 3 n=1 Tax=Iris pallida TaxID=29817 RepID=A0AAX6E1V2_IRIPA|nr:pollen-specific leucine-rich repeat extensin-like protein 3 [Iris pallida]KAJ6798062.1 pollen-specific leucine-rich repeat extensin-like protein 3 [Iris pallida]